MAEEGGEEISEEEEEEENKENEEKNFGEALIKVREESKMSIDDNEELGYDPDQNEVEEGLWIKGKHDILANNLSLFPYSRYYLIYLGNLAIQSKIPKDNGPAWFIEKQINRCVGGITSSDTVYLLKYGLDSFSKIIKGCKDFSNKTYEQYDSDSEISSDKVCSGRMKRHLINKIKKYHPVKTQMRGKVYQSEVEYSEEEED